MNFVASVSPNRLELKVCARWTVYSKEWSFESGAQQLQSVATCRYITFTIRLRTLIYNASLNLVSLRVETGEGRGAKEPKSKRVR